MKKIFPVFYTIFLIHTLICVQPITKVIVPMAGLGTRLLPLTKAAPKSMVCLIDKPALHHVVDEALQSSIKDFCFIINDNDREAIEDYFSPDLLLDAILKEDLVLSYFPAEEPAFRAEIVWNPCKFPIKAQEMVGNLKLVTENGKVLKELPVYAAHNVDQKWWSVVGDLCRNNKPFLLALFLGGQVVLLLLYLVRKNQKVR